MSAKVIVLAVLLFTAGSAHSQTADSTGFWCGDCRNFTTGPGAGDALNFAYNQLWGPTGWMDFNQADFFSISDPYGNMASVDMNLRIDGITIPILEIEIPFPTRVLIQAIIRDENGFVIKTDMKDPNQTNWPLPVGGPAESGGGSGGGGGSSSGSGGGGSSSGSGGGGDSSSGGGGGGAGRGGRRGGGGGAYCGPGTEYYCVQR